MTPNEAKKRHAELAAEIRRHDRAYYVEGRQIITDREYDQLFKELQELEKNFPGLVTRPMFQPARSSQHWQKLASKRKLTSRF